MIKTRVYVEESEVSTKYYAQIQQRLFGFKYWRCVSYGNSYIENLAIAYAAGKSGDYKSTSKLHAETVCQYIHDYCMQEAENKDKERKHKTTRKVYSYLFPKED